MDMDNVTDEEKETMEALEEELRAFMRQLGEREVDPLLATSLVIHQFVTLARQLFENPLAYTSFIFSVAHNAAQRGEELHGYGAKEDEEYVH